MVAVLVECNHVRGGSPMATVTNSEFLFSPTQIEMVGTTVNLPCRRFVYWHNLGIILEKNGPNFSARRCYTAQLSGTGISVGRPVF